MLQQPWTCKEIDDVENSPYLAFHWISVDLAHVHPSVFLMDIFDVEVPYGVINVWHGNTWIMDNHVVVYRLDCFCICFYPANLKKLIKKLRQNSEERNALAHQNSVVHLSHIANQRKVSFNIIHKVNIKESFFRSL